MSRNQKVAGSSPAVVTNFSPIHLLMTIGRWRLIEICIDRIALVMCIVYYVLVLFVPVCNLSCVFSVY